MLLKKYLSKTNTHSPKILNNYCISIYSSLLFIWTVNSVQIEWSSQFIFVITCKIKGQHNFGCKSVCLLCAYMHIRIAVCACVCKHMHTHALNQIKLHLRCTGGKKVLFLEVEEWVKPKQKTFNNVFLSKRKICKRDWCVTGIPRRNPPSEGSTGHAAEWCSCFKR